jgi:two-component system, sensor histidine kinase
VLKKVIARYRKVAITRKLFLAAGISLLVVFAELLILFFMMRSLSAIRAYVGAEGLWSKAQKDASYHLYKYACENNEEDYRAFVSYLNVPLGGRKTRLELNKKKPDFALARQGLRENRVHEKDIDGMIKLFRRFHRIVYLNTAIGYWTQGDSLIQELLLVGAELHKKISHENLEQRDIAALSLRIDELNKQLTVLEDNFSYVLGEGSRWLEKLGLQVLLYTVVLVELIALILFFSISREIIIKNKELALKNSEALRRATQLRVANKDLTTFTNVSSHDLQEPLRKIRNFVSVLMKEEQARLSEEGKDYLQKTYGTAKRMQELIDDLLRYAHIYDSDKKFEKLDLNLIFEKVLLEFDKEIERKEAIINTDKLCQVEAIKPQIAQLFRNLISNSLKFSKDQLAPRISIKSSVEQGRDMIEKFGIVVDGTDTNIFANAKYCLLSFQDNGIGFEPLYNERIFEVFQRLHSKEAFPGNGIGLAICKRIVHFHKGYISATGELGVGARFDILLPLQQEPYL